MIDRDMMKPKQNINVGSPVFSAYHLHKCAA